VLVYSGAPGHINFYEETGDFDEDYPGLQITLLDELARRAGFEWRNSWGAGKSLRCLVLYCQYIDEFTSTRPQHFLPIFIMVTDYSRMQL
jgi:hypothetical protein